MKILNVIASMNPGTGGPCEIIRNVSPALTGMGAHSETVCLDDPDASFIQSDTLCVHALGAGSGPWRYHKKLLPWLEENLHRFDKVMIHGLWLYPGYAVMQAMNRIKKQRSHAKSPAVYVMPHGMLDPYFQVALHRRLKALRNRLYWKWVQGKIVNRADGVVFTCQTELTLARQSFQPYLPKGEFNIGYGIAPAPLYHTAMAIAFAQKVPEAHGSPYLLFLGRIHPKKGVDLLLRSYANLVESWETNDNKTKAKLPKLVIAGPGMDTPFGEKMRTEAVAINRFGEKVIFPGMLTGDAKWGAFYGCEAFVLPSHQENFGIAVAEALACSKPVLISNQVNIWREIETASAGLVADDTQRGVASLLQNWLSLSAEEKRGMGRKARQCYAADFAVEPAAKRLLSALV